MVKIRRRPKSNLKPAYHLDGLNARLEPDWNKMYVPAIETIQPPGDYQPVSACGDYLLPDHSLPRPLGGLKQKIATAAFSMILALAPESLFLRAPTADCRPQAEVTFCENYSTSRGYD